MSRRKQAKPRALKPEEEEWNDETAAAERGRKRTFSEREKEDNDNDDDEPNDLQDESGCNEENKGDENEECNDDEPFEDGEDADPNETKEELYERENVADVADIKSESMDSFESDKTFGFPEEVFHDTDAEKVEAVEGPEEGFMKLPLPYFPAIVSSKCCRLAPVLIDQGERDEDLVHCE